MSRTANCPSCGAPIEFRWSSAVQTTCEFCRSILVRHDLDLERVGVVADIPLDASPIQIGTEGVFDGRTFQVIGRIVYEYEQGNWNEWHLVFHDSSSGWLSDAQLEYAVSFLTPPPQPLPARHEIRRDRGFVWSGITYELTTITNAHYAGVQGELPFQYWDKQDITFADLRSSDAHFGTIDYSEEPPLLFLGRAVEFTELRLRNLRTFEGWS